MKASIWISLFAAGLGLAVPGSTAAADVRESPEEAILRRFEVGRDDRSLLAFLKARSEDDRSEKRIAALVEQLGAEKFVSARRIT
jgi:hypothetical protein